MRIITKNGWYTKDNILIERLEPWTTDQEVSDDLFDTIPSKVIIIEPPSGFRFKEGISASDYPTRKDVELILKEDADPSDDLSDDPPVSSKIKSRFKSKNA